MTLSKADYIKLYAAAIELHGLATSGGRSLRVRAKAIATEILDSCEKVLGPLHRPDRGAKP